MQKVSKDFLTTSQMGGLLVLFDTRLDGELHICDCQKAHQHWLGCRRYLKVGKRDRMFLIQKVVVCPATTSFCRELILW